MGPEIAAVIRSRGVAAKQGFLMYYSKGDAIGTRVSVRYRRSGRLSEVVVKRGSTVIETEIQKRPKLLTREFRVRSRGWKGACLF